MRVWLFRARAFPPPAAQRCPTPGGRKVLRQRPLVAEEGYCGAHWRGSASNSGWAEMWSITADVSNRRADLTPDDRSDDELLRSFSSVLFGSPDSPLRWKLSVSSTSSGILIQRWSVQIFGHPLRLLALRRLHFSAILSQKLFFHLSVPLTPSARFCRGSDRR
ncbi:hypothetical protein AOLI_G00072190 [Acnodon oligacanthus]